MQEPRSTLKAGTGSLIETVPLDFSALYSLAFLVPRPIPDGAGMGWYGYLARFIPATGLPISQNRL
jgi:hypothetical protein